MASSRIIYAGPAKAQRCSLCSISHAGMCGALTGEELRDLNEIASIRHYKPGDIILSEEEEIGSYANVVRGMIKLTKNTLDGREQIVAMLFASDFFGRVYGDRSHHNAIAVTEVELCTYPRQRFEQLLRKYPDIEHRLFEEVLDELDAAQDWMLLLGRKNALEKVATFLLMLEKRLARTTCVRDHNGAPNEDDPVKIHLPMTRSDMADYLGLTTETVCRQMTYLKREGAILLPDNHSIVVRSQEQLLDHSG